MDKRTLIRTICPQTVNAFELNEHACAKKCNAAFQSSSEGNVVCQVERLVARDRNIKKLVNSELLTPLFQIDYVGSQLIMQDGVIAHLNATTFHCM